MINVDFDSRKENIQKFTSQVSIPLLKMATVALETKGNSNR